MFSYRFSFFCVMGILCIYLCVGHSHVKKCAETDRRALLKLKDGFIDEKDSLSSWNGEYCCKWKGISCDNFTGHVTSLNIHNSGHFSRLGGNLDSSICELKYLTSLDLSYNNLKGKIPKCTGSLGQLIELKLAFNELGSGVPPTLGNLSNLQTLHLNKNYLVANDLEWLSHLSNLKYLDLSYVNLSQAVDWLSSISKIPFLVELNLIGCGLPQVNLGSIPHLNSSTSLKILSLSKNELNSSTLSCVLNVSKVLTHFYLSFNSLSSIPDGFANMISLKYLDLRYNELQGNIPKFFQSLCQLKRLWLYFNKLSGQLNDCIGQLCGPKNSLEWLDLSHNPFSGGPLPDFSWLSSLKILSLRNTSIVGSLSQSLFKVSKLASLEQLDLSHNQLSGTLPYAIGQFSNLRRLCLSSNKLDGVINEGHLSNLSELTELSVARNSLSFNLSSNWIAPFQLHRLSASSCILGPKFPTWLRYQRKLLELQISNSSISGSFPKWFWALSPGLLLLNVSHNELSGGLPKSLPGTKTLIPGAWDFSFNHLSGPLPPFPELYTLILSNNNFSGSLSSFCASSPLSLTILDLSNNLLAGPLSDCWEKFETLQVLNLAKNNLSGKIPKSFGTLRQMKSIHLNNNNFSGEIPSLVLCSSLKFIDFGYNNIQGTLPAWIGHHLQLLTILRLRANKFQGNIPTSLCNLFLLQVLDLSQNSITGEIPQCLSNIIALSSMKFHREPFLYLPYFARSYDDDDDDGMLIETTMLAWKGDNRDCGKNLGFMIMIDLSCNHLTGKIPQNITKLVALVSLNLSRNNLTGFIPNNIGHMEMLESLDLSRNHLYGRMPSSFSNLTFLSYMDLAFNNLSGKIPLSTQLQSFNASTYEGNDGLCGPPLTKPYLGDSISPSGSPDKHASHEDEDELITFGFYVSLGLGLFMGFSGVCGTLVVKTSWRHAYFQFFNNVKDWLYVTLMVFMVRMKRRFQVQY